MIVLVKSGQLINEVYIMRAKTLTDYKTQTSPFDYDLYRYGNFHICKESKGVKIFHNEEAVGCAVLKASDTGNSALDLLIAFVRESYDLAACYGNEKEQSFIKNLLNEALTLA